MRFWDSSAVVPLLAREATSEMLYGLLWEDGDMAVWWGTWAECAVAISRLRREGRFDEEGEEGGRAVLDLLAALVSKQHPLKAADALQLAAALRWCEGDTSGAGFVCLDEKLRRAASNEGFDVLPEPSAEETR